MRGFMRYNTDREVILMSKYRFVAIARLIDNNDKVLGFRFKDTCMPNTPLIDLTDTEVNSLKYRDFVDVRFNGNSFVYKQGVKKVSNLDKVKIQEQKVELINKGISQKSRGTMVYERNDYIELCHGSRQVIEVPKYGQGEESNDYGRGFYTVLRPNIELAREWACSPYNNTNKGYVTTYNFCTKDLRILNLDKEPIIYWIVLTATYRGVAVDQNKLSLLQSKYLLNISNYDCVYGYRCDDTYSNIIRTFMGGYCTDQAIAEAVHLGHLKEQFVLVSPTAFSRIKYIEDEQVDDFRKYRQRFDNRKNEADRGLRECVRRNRGRGKDIEDYIEELNK